MPVIDNDEIERRFSSYPPTPETHRVHDAVRAAYISHAENLLGLFGEGESREKSLLFTALEESSFWAHAHIARNMQ